MSDAPGQTPSAAKLLWMLILVLIRKRNGKLSAYDPGGCPLSVIASIDATNTNLQQLQGLSRSGEYSEIGGPISVLGIT